MDVYELLGEINSSKKYAGICEETILRILSSEITKHKKSKEVVKSVKNRLHQITGAFLNETDPIKARRLLDSWNESDPADIARSLLALHASSRERLDFYPELLGDIFSVTGAGSVLDLACGFNPFAMALNECNPVTEYFATDIHFEIIELVGRFFSLAGIKGEAFVSDILYKIPAKKVHNVILFKLLPLLEQQKKGCSEALLSGLETEFITITFPTRSISGKNVGMVKTYGAFIKTVCPESRYEYCFEKEYKNELLYIVRQKNSSISL
ncbi:MAG: methyltransferase [Clostridiales bacterium]|jgi:16S rRNA (guanine(1405)-N(7))-methyltransferase|nr:methyltransferase [Clostridiales bacterium]